ncbi:hypothetical protein EVAR_84902_1 [Eumeta japonica]|uniref:Uncharacterized protein n=1 Tax=Eumeta variegata TaxID=151549 RepID=A0A4C1YEK1_EUMVA|nr:hypothetical protein EVAR_84902_1 [Eumeta japonica]
MDWKLLTTFTITNAINEGCAVSSLSGRDVMLLAGERARRTGGPPTPMHSPTSTYKCLKEKYARLKHNVKMSIERRNKRRELSMTTGSETEKSDSHKVAQSLERYKLFTTLLSHNNNPVS